MSKYLYNDELLCICNKNFVSGCGEIVSETLLKFVHASIEIKKNCMAVIVFANDDAATVALASFKFENKTVSWPFQ